MTALPVFVVGTGRCGSTLLSEMIQANPLWCSISECFAALDVGVFPPGEPTGRQMADLVTTPRVGTSLLVRHGIEPSEFLYPLDRPGARYSRLTGVAPIAMTALPHLSDDPDTLVDRVSQYLEARPPSPAARHYQALFDWLAEERSAHTWFERSGGSMAYVGELAEKFPGARFVHIYRDGAATAVSMSRHSAFRLMVARLQMALASGVDPYVSPARPPELLTGEFADLLPERFTADALMSREMPLRWFAALWSRVTTQGLRVLGGLEPARVHHVSFEDLLADPPGEAERLARFVDGSPDEGWVRRAASLVDRRAPQPGPVVDAGTEAALGPGNRVIGALRTNGLATPGRRRRRRDTAPPP